MAQPPRIDLNHGYMRFIRRNQVDRDEFDRCHERRKSEIRERLEKPNRPANIYIPPHLRDRPRVESLDRSLSRSDSDSQEDEKQRTHEESIRTQVRRRIERTHATVDDICVSLANYSLREAENKTVEKEPSADLFTLELTLQNGEKKSVGVPRNTQAARLAKCLSRENDFDDFQCRNLRLFIEEQLEKRLAREKARQEQVSPTSPSSTASFCSTGSCPSPE